MISLVNLVPTLILRSPMHGILSGRYAILRMTGRSSGDIIAIPVAYIREGGHLVLSTDSAWRGNITRGRSAEVLVEGRWLRATGRRVVDRARAALLLGELVRRVPGYARPAGLPSPNGRVLESAIADAVVRRRWVVELAEVA